MVFIKMKGSLEALKPVFVVAWNPAVVCAIQALAGLVVGKSLQDIVSNFRGFYRLLTSDGQMRWVRADT